MMVTIPAKKYFEKNLDWYLQWVNGGGIAKNDSCGNFSILK